MHATDAEGLTDAPFVFATDSGRIVACGDTAQVLSGTPAVR